MADHINSNLTLKNISMTIKKLVFIVPVLALFSCNGSSEPTNGSDTTATTTPEVLDSNTVTATNADQVKFFEDSPESVTRYFYASRIRGDEKWQSVCISPAQRSPEFVEDLALHDQKIIIRYEQLSTNYIENTCNVHMELEWADAAASAPSETFEHIAFLEKIDGIWWIVGFSAAVTA
jgi:hypothetical protein